MSARRSAAICSAPTARRCSRSWASCCASRGLTIAAAESCTGGLVMARLTEVPGSSDYVDRGVVVYSNQSKTDLLGVPASLIAAHGAVSEPVAEAMASGMVRSAGTDVAVGITGVAGPRGGTPEKPVGMVAIAAAWVRNGTIETRVRTFNFVGGREMVRFQASQAALDMVRRWMTGVGVACARAEPSRGRKRLFIAVDIDETTRGAGRPHIDGCASSRSRVEGFVGASGSHAPDAAILRQRRRRPRAARARRAGRRSSSRLRSICRSTASDFFPSAARHASCGLGLAPVSSSCARLQRGLAARD